MSKIMMIIVNGIAAICAELLKLGEIVVEGPFSADQIEKDKKLDVPELSTEDDFRDVDSLGLPWDERINSSGKTQYKSNGGEDKPAGAWVLKRGITTAAAAQVRSELRLAQGPADDAPEVNEAPELPESRPLDPAALTVPDEPTIVSFKDFVVKVSTQKPPFTAEQLQEACLMNGLGNIKELKDSPLAIPGVVESLWPAEVA